jgi:pilus assembly protein CpaD
MSPKRRIFIHRNRFRGPTMAAVAIVMLAIVAACAPEASHWSSEQKIKRNDVRWITFQHEVRFGAADTAVTAAERARLHRFLARHEAGYGDKVMVGSRGVRATSTDVRRAGRRESLVAGELRQLKLPAGLLPDAPSREAWNGSVRVVVGRFVVIPPECPDWSKRADGDPANRVSSNFGCATATNFGLMVANPGDIVRGRTAGAADGAVGARRYKTYREGEQQKSPAITPLVIQSSVGGGKK